MTLLLLAGTGEARLIAQQLAISQPDAIASLSGATRAAAQLGLKTRIGGFGGEAGFRAFLAENEISAILDATHPFAARITKRTARVAAELNLPYLQLLRPRWQAGPGDIWQEIDCEEDAASIIPQGACVFLATGRQTLPGFAGLAGRRIFCRQIDPPDAPFPFEGGEYVIGRPPFSVEQEVELFTRLGVEWLVVKNAGGQASRTKLDAARILGIKVLMIRRPAPPQAQRVQTVWQALEWVRGL